MSVKKHEVDGVVFYSQKYANSWEDDDEVIAGLVHRPNEFSRYAILDKTTYVTYGDAGSCAYIRMCGLTRDAKQVPDKEYMVMADFLIDKFLKGKKSRPIIFYLAKDESPLAPVLTKHGFRAITACTSKHAKYDVELWIRPASKRVIRKVAA